jgi:hypothetical protein
LANYHDKEKPPVYMAHTTLGNVEREVKNVAPRLYREDLGPCWFLDLNFKMATRESFYDDYLM